MRFVAGRNRVDRGGKIMRTCGVQRHDFGHALLLDSSTCSSVIDMTHHGDTPLTRCVVQAQPNLEI